MSHSLSEEYSDFGVKEKISFGSENKNTHQILLSYKVGLNSDSFCVPLLTVVDA